MNDNERKKFIKTSWDLHSQVEAEYLNHSAKKDDSDWPEKQRYLLADMAIHLLQTSMNPGSIRLDKLRNNLHSILTISDQFLPHAELKKATDKLYE